MSQETISILSILVNFILVIFKLVLGFLTNSAALIAEGVHFGENVNRNLKTSSIEIKLTKASRLGDIVEEYGT